ncbi:unnamed protein product [Closterium sp. NIES-53]
MYAATDSAEGDFYLCVPPDPGIAAAALGASASTAPGTSESAAPGAGESALSSKAPTEALHTFTLDSGALRSFFRDSTTLTPLSRPVAVSLADPSRGPVLAHSSTVLPCPAAPSGLLSGLHLPSFSTNLVSGADLQDAWADQFTPGGQRVTHCTCSRTGRHLATFTRRPGSSLYTLTTASPPVTASGQVAALVRCFLPRPGLVQRRPPARVVLCHTRLSCGTTYFVTPPCLVFEGHERYFLLVVDDYSRYTTVFPLRRKDRGGEFSSELLRAFCRAEGIRQTFTLPASPQKNGIAERSIGMVMDVARASMIHAATPHFLWPFAVQYAAHQINLQPRVSLPETTPTLRWTGKVDDASVFRFYHPTLHRVLSSEDVTFDELVSYYHPVEPVEVAVDSGAARGREPAGAGTGGVEPGGAESGDAEPGGADPGGAEPESAESGGPLGVPSRREPLSPQQLREWYTRRCSRAAGGASGAAGGAAGAGAAGADGPGGAGAGGTAGAEGASGARASGGTAGAGAARAAGVGGPAGVGAGGGATGVGAVGVGAVAIGGAAGAGAAGGTRAGGAGAGGAAGVVAGDPGYEGTGVVSAISGGTARLRPYYVPLLQQVLCLPPSTGPPPPFLSPPPVLSQSQLQPASPLPCLTERREPESRPASPESRPASPESRPESPARDVPTGRRVPRQRPPPVPGTHSMTLRP